MSAAWLFTCLLLFGRMTGLFLSMPVLSSAGLPRFVPVFLSMCTTVVLAPTVTVQPMEIDLLRFGLLFGGELGLGWLAGTTINILFNSLTMASELISTQTGMAMANVFNPLLKTSSSALGQVGLWLSGLIFLQTGLHLMTLEILANGLNSAPLGGWWPELTVFGGLLQYMGQFFTYALQLSTPVLALVWIINLIMGLLAKLAPKMNVFFAVGMTLSNVGGIVIFALSLSMILTSHHELLLDALTWVNGLLSGPQP